MPVSPPLLRIDTSNTSSSDVADDGRAWPSPFLSKSYALVHTPLLPSDERPSTDFGRSFSKGNKRARAESRKLLSHVLVQLRTRPMPPTVYDSYMDTKDTTRGSNIGVVLDTMKDAMKSKASIAMRSSSQTFTIEDDTEDNIGLVYSTDDTYELMFQLRNVLLVSDDQGWRIFDDEPNADDSKTISPFRRTRSGFRGNRSNSPSPVRGSQVNAPELLMQCVSVLSSVVQEDCRYKASAPRLLRPPNALHALCLDIAQFLIGFHKHNSKVVSDIAHAMILSFSTFPKEMHGKLLKFFEECVIWGPMQDLRALQIGGDHDFYMPEGSDKTGDNKAFVTIRIDQADDDSEHGVLHNYDSAHSDPAILSTNAPLQLSSIYHLSSIVPPLLAAILENVDVHYDHHHPELNQRFRRLISALSQLKPDACNDILQVIAYYTPQARLLACSVLMTSWRTSLGHSVVSEPLTNIQINANLSNAHEKSSHPFSHHFVPWRFLPIPRPNSLRSSCHSCSNLIVDFGLICPLCMCSVHFECYDYPQGCSLIQYSMGADHAVKKVAMYRFCHVITQEQRPPPLIPRAQSHDFHALNLFTLCLCFGCQKPLWGCFSQGIGCASCSIFFHMDCLTSLTSDIPPCEYRVIDSDYMVINWTELRNTFIDYYRHILPTDQNALGRCSYEEVAIYLAIFWIQFQILANGVAMGSIVVTQNGEDVPDISQVDKFELHDIIRRSQALLESDSLGISQALSDYQFENRLSRREHNLMFDWSCLAFITSIIRGPHEPAHTPQLGSSDFLHVEKPVPLKGHSPEDASHSMVPIGLVRWILGHELNIVSEPAVHHILEILPKLGFFQVLESENRSLCSFALPFGFDSSIEVEILVSAIEACLSHENLSVNEVGFLLLNRRLLPNGMSSEYALTRLARCVIAWLLSEDIAVASILRDFVAKQENLPGVPLTNKTLVWPERPTLRPASSSNTNGGDYVAFRRALHSRYSAVWLLSLHDQDPALYVEVLYDACVDFEKVQGLDSSVDGVGSLKSKSESNRHQNILRWIIKLLQASVVYSAFDKLISRWMDSASRSNFKEPMTFLHRVFELERNNMFRFSTSSDSATADIVNHEPLSIDPWRPILTLASQGGSELTRSLDWLNLLASGGVQIPTPHLLRFVSFISEEKDLEDGIALVSAGLKNAWLNPIGRQDLLFVFYKLHVNLSSTIVAAIYNNRDPNIAFQFIRQSLASCLVLFGCDRNRLIELGMIIDDETRGFPPRRKINLRSSFPEDSDPITVNQGMMNALERYINMNHNDVSRIIAIFFNAFLTESPFMEAYEVDNFIVRNGKILAKSSWQLYNIQRPELYETRASLFSRVIVVDSQPFYNIFSNCLLRTVPWEERLSAVTRLFRVLLDITNPAFKFEGRHWRSSMAVILYFYLEPLWTDDKEEVRLAIKTSASTLLPAHLQAMESSWAELLLTAPVPERVKLTSFLLRVQPFFPRWQVLPWSAITDVLLEGDEDINKHGNEVIPDTISLRVSLLLISLHMITSGASVSVLTLLRIKKYLAAAIGFENVIGILQLDGQIVRVEFGDVATIAEEVVPCIDKLTAILDSPLPFELTPSMMTYSYGQDDKPSKLLVGSLFVDLILVMFCTLTDLSSLPEPTLKRILESLCIVVYKHDFESAALLHLQHRLRQAVSRSSELILQDVSYELRQVALSFIQGFIKQCDKFMGHVFYKAIEQLGKLIAAEVRNPSDALVVQAKVFLEDIFTAYGFNGLFVNLFKRPLTYEFFIVLREIFENMRKDNAEDPRKALLDEVIPRVVDFDRDSFQAALHNLSTYIEVVYREGHAADTVKLIGQLLVSLARRVSGEDHMDPSPLFSIPTILSENNQGRISDLAPYIGTAVPIILLKMPVAFNTLFRLLIATQSLQRRNDSVIFASGVAKFVFDVLEDGLRTKQKTPPSSLTNLLQLVIHDESPEWLPLAVTYPSLFLDLAGNALYFLQTYEWPEARLEDAYMASLSAATVIWHAVDRDARVIEKLAQLGFEKLSPIDYRIRAWNMLVMSALKHSDKKCAAVLLSLLGVFSNIQFNALRANVHSEAPNWDLATANINHAYVAIKLWMMVACKIPEQEVEGVSITSTPWVWNELWPPFEILAFNAEKQNDLHPGLALLISSSVADLFIFLHSLQTPLSSQTTQHIATLDRLKNMAGMDAANRKVTRAIYSLSQPPTPLALEVLVNQASKEIVAAEKLRVLESKKEIGKGQTERRPVERFKRDVRLQI